MTEPRPHHDVFAHQVVRDIAKEYPVNFIAMMAEPAAIDDPARLRDEAGAALEEQGGGPALHARYGVGPPPGADAFPAAVGTILAAPAGAV